MLDVFGGTGHVARSFRRRGRAAIVIDIAKHPCLDILDPIVQQTVLGWLRSGKVLAVFLAPFCGLGRVPGVGRSTTRDHRRLCALTATSWAVRGCP